MRIKLFLQCIIVIFQFSQPSFSQDNTNTSTEYLTFSVLQLFPSPTFISDASSDNKNINIALRWQIIPLNFSFRANKYVSPAQFIMINPVRRFSGSAEIFIQPEYSLGNTPANSGFSRFTLGTGVRLLIPLKNQGETFAASIGGKYSIRKDNSGADDNNYFGIEGGLYMFFGMVGLQTNYNFDKRSRFSIGFYFKYF